MNLSLKYLWEDSIRNVYILYQDMVIKQRYLINITKLYYIIFSIIKLILIKFKG